MEKSEHQKLIDSIKQSQERSRQTLQNVQHTLKGVNQTLVDIKTTNDNIDKIKDQYNKVMEKLAENIAKSFGSDPLKKIEGKYYQNLPKLGKISEVINSIKKYNQILIITGAGVSADSGIPTFRGKNGLYSAKFEFDGQQYEPQQFINSSFYNKNPQPIWKWVDDIYTMSSQSKPNQIHYLIDSIANQLVNLGKKVVLVTQNIDDLHLKPKNSKYEYYNVHGNVKYMRCSNNHLSPYSKQKIGTKCLQKNCITEDNLRPHVLFFDECYGELYGKQVKDRKFPFTIVIGSSLQTNLCKRLVLESEEIVQINPEPVIEVGNVHTFSRNVNSALGSILKGLLNQPYQEADHAQQKVEWVTQSQETTPEQQTKGSNKKVQINVKSVKNDKSPQVSKFDDSKAKVESGKKIVTKQIASKTSTGSNAIPNKTTQKKK